MGNIIEWNRIEPEATYTLARVYRSLSRDTGYVMIATLPIESVTYYDIDGTTLHWYKVDFYDTVALKASSLSDPIQGGTFRGYCTVQDVRAITNVNSSDVTDTNLANLIDMAGSQLNHDIQVYRFEERIMRIDDTRPNTIDGTNKQFFVRFWPIGDMNNDKTVDISDVHVYTVQDDGTKSQVTVESINPDEGYFTLSIAPDPSISRLIVTYYSASLSVAQPHPLVKMACMWLAAAWAYTKINIGKSPRWKMGGTQIWRDVEAFDKCYQMYLKLIQQINARYLGNAIVGKTMEGEPYYDRSSRYYIGGYYGGNYGLGGEK